MREFGSRLERQVDAIVSYLAEGFSDVSGQPAMEVLAMRQASAASFALVMARYHSLADGLI